MAVIFEKRAENLGACLPGFGIVFAVHENAHKRCTIASPLEVALNALSQETSKDKTCNLQLVSKYLYSLRVAMLNSAIRFSIPLEKGTFQEFAAKIFTSLLDHLRMCDDFGHFCRDVKSFLLSRYT